MKKLCVTAVFALALCLLICAFVPAAGAAGTDECGMNIHVTYGQTDARAMLELINGLRQPENAWYWNETDTAKVWEQNLQPLTYDYGLEQVAMQRAAELAVSYSHTRPDGTSCFTAYGDYCRYGRGENIAAGYNAFLDGESVFIAWSEENDPYAGQGHRRNMLDADFTCVGVGHVYYNGRHYWTQEFGLPTTGVAYTAPLDGDATVWIPMSATGHQDENNDHYCDLCGAKLSDAEPVKITAQPKNAAVAANGDKATFTVKAAGDGLTYKWYCKNPGDKKFSASSVTAATFSSIMTDARNGRQVYCVVTDAYGNTERSKTVVMSRLAVTSQPENAAVAKNGEKAVFTVEASGEGLTYKWYCKNPGDAKFSAASVTASAFSSIMTDARNGRQVYCAVTDRFGNTVKTNTVVMSRLSVTTQPKNAAVAKNGDKAAFTVKASGTGLTYKWYCKNPGDTKFSAASTTTAAFSSIMTDARNGRQVYCMVTDQYGNAVKTKTVVMSRLSVTAQPRNAVVAAVNKTCTFTVRASGTGLSYKWYYKNADADKFTASATATNTYSVVMTNARNGRQVYCVVSDQFGNTVKTVTVTMTIR